MTESSSAVLWGLPAPIWAVAIPAIVALMTTIGANYWQGKRELRLLKSQVSLRAHESDYNRLLKIANDAPMIEVKWTIPVGSTLAKPDPQKVLDDLFAFEKWARVTLSPLLTFERKNELDRILQRLGSWTSEAHASRTSGTNIASDPTGIIVDANTQTLALITEQLKDLRKALVLP